MEQEKYFQKMVLEHIDIHVQKKKNESKQTPYILHNNWLKIYYRPT